MSELYAALTEQILALLPHLRPAYDREVREYWGNDLPGPHVVFGNLLTPHLIQLLRTDENEIELHRIFGFLEGLSASGVKDVEEVVAFSVIESVAAEQDLLDRAWKLMGPRTRSMAKEVQSYWGMATRVPDSPR